MRSSWFAVVYGVWITIMLMSSVLSGEANLDVLDIVLFLIYLLALAVLLVAPVWQTHVEMARFKRGQLELIATKIQTLLDAAIDPRCETEHVELMKILRDRYQLVHDAYREWPLRLPAIRGFSIAAMIPVATTVITSFVKNAAH